MASSTPKTGPAKKPPKKVAKKATKPAAKAKRLFVADLSIDNPKPGAVAKKSAAEQKAGLPAGSLKNVRDLKGATAVAVKGAAASLTDKTKGAADLLGAADAAVAQPPFKNDKLEVLLQSQHTAQDRAASIRGAAAAELKAAKEKGLNIDAFKLIAKLERKSPEDRNAFLSAFDSMRLERGYATQGNLFGDVEPEPKAEDKTDDRKPSGKVAAAGK